MKSIFMHNIFFYSNRTGGAITKVLNVVEAKFRFGHFGEFHMEISK